MNTQLQIVVDFIWQSDINRFPKKESEKAMEAMQLVSGPHLLESMQDTSVGMWPSEFALMIGVRVSTLQNWEQGRRNPDCPARALLKVASENPEAVSKALEA